MDLVAVDPPSVDGQEVAVVAHLSLDAGILFPYWKQQSPHCKFSMKFEANIIYLEEVWLLWDDPVHVLRIS